MTKHSFSYLALGDSYTIGESVALHESFPYQVVQLLRKRNLHINAPEIVAKTGWTTFELAEHILHHQLAEKYDFVTLLIGVNNQYRGLEIDDYKEEFEFLLKKAIQFADQKAEHVIVLSIPDWAATPFAKKEEKEKIAEAIRSFNKINKQISATHNVHYIDITGDSLAASSDSEMVAKDKLHYSGKQHSIWAEKVAEVIENMISKKN
jgi:lysophospholipase L1-like esterase